MDESNEAPERTHGHPHDRDLTLAPNWDSIF